MKNNIKVYVLPPIIFVVLLWLSTLAFNLLSAPSDFKVVLGISILIVIFAFIYRFIISLLK